MSSQCSLHFLPFFSAYNRLAVGRQTSSATPRLVAGRLPSAECVVCAIFALPSSRKASPMPVANVCLLRAIHAHRLQEHSGEHKIAAIATMPT